MRTARVSLPRQQELLQQRMLIQRTQLVRLLQPAAPAASHGPRSLIMHFCGEHPGLAIQLLARSISLLAGRRMLRTAVLALLLGIAVRGLAKSRS